jgi:hypothetical protein
MSTAATDQKEIQAVPQSSSDPQVATSSKKSRTKGKSLASDGSVYNTLADPTPHVRVKGIVNPIHRFRQSVTLTGATSTAVGNINNGNYFYLGLLPQASTFTALFDQYRITLIECWVNVINPQSATGAAVNRGRMLTVIDYDDANALSTEGQYQEYENCVVTSATQSHYRAWKPHAAIAAYSSGAFGAYANLESPWIDCGSPSVQHYGLKTLLTPADAAGNVVSYELFCRMTVEFRQVR